MSRTRTTKGYPDEGSEMSESIYGYDVELAIAAEARHVVRADGNHGEYLDKSTGTYMLRREAWDAFMSQGWLIDGRLTDEARGIGVRRADEFRTELRGRP